MRSAEKKERRASLLLFTLRTQPVRSEAEQCLNSSAHEAKKEEQQCLLCVVEG